MELIGTINPDNLSDDDIKEYRFRTAVRFVVFDKDNKVALNHRPKQFGYEEQNSIPGGGVEEGESIENALGREALEEIGCNITNIKEIGNILEYDKSSGLVQKNYLFFGKVAGEKKKPLFTESEIETNLSVIWLPLGEAISAVERMSECLVKTRSLLILNKITSQSLLSVNP